MGLVRVGVGGSGRDLAMCGSPRKLWPGRSETGGRDKWWQRIGGGKRMGRGSVAVGSRW